MLLKGERREVASCAEHARLRKNRDTTNTVNFHFDIGITVGVAEVSQVGPPGGVLGITFHNDGIFIKSIGERKSGLRLLPRVEIIWLFAAEPVGKWTPDI